MMEKSLIYLNKKKAKRVRKKRKVKHKATNKENNSFQLAENVLINYAHPRKYIRKYVQELKRISIGSFVKIAIKTIFTIFTASFASKFIPIVVKMKMMISGSDAITAIDG
jgi:hypothetical protein